MVTIEEQVVKLEGLVDELRERRASADPPWARRLERHRGMFADDDVMQEILERHPPVHLLKATTRYSEYKPVVDQSLDFGSNPFFANCLREPTHRSSYRDRLVGVTGTGGLTPHRSPNDGETQ